MPGPLLSLISSIETLMIIRAVIPCLAIIAVGYLVGRFDQSRNENTLSSLIYFVFSPALVFSALHRHPFIPLETAAIGASTFLLMAGLLPFALFIGKRAGSADNGYILSMLFMSSGTVLLPLSYLLFGSEGLAKAVMFHLFSSFLFYSVGCWLTDGHTRLRRFFRSPSFIAAAFGMISASPSVRPPYFLSEFLILTEKGIDIICIGALPVLLISYGYPLSRLRCSDIPLGISGGLTRMIAGPFLAFILVFLSRKLNFLPMDKGYNLLFYIDMRTTEAVIILGSAMPGAMSCYLSNKWRGSHVAETLSMLAVGAAIGVVSIPVVMLLTNVLIFTD